MNQEDIKNLLSDININSETAVEAVELYIKFMYFDKFLDFLAGLCFVFGASTIVWFVGKKLWESDDAP